MLEKEVEYRLCRWILANLVGDGLLTEAEGVETNRLLLEKLDPPFRQQRTWTIKSEMGCGFMSERNIVKIDPIPKMLGIKRDEVRRLRVAAYARVSTDHEDQQNSFDAQVDYYKKLIAEHLEWEFVRVYADEGSAAAAPMAE